MKPNTHLKISSGLVGEPGELLPGKSTARLATTAEMAADERGLVHGGFTFGLADYAAMLAVNDPNVVLGSCGSRFLAPVAVGDILEATAEVIEEKGRKRIVTCQVRTDRLVFEGDFTCFVLDGHVLDP